MSTTVQHGNLVEHKRSLQDIPIGGIFESTLNPRRHFDEVKLTELAANIKEVGILNPLLVRPSGDSVYEIAAGHRRYRAAKLAGLQELPCIVRPLTDEQFMEILTVENLQREDVHPLDEAKGYEALMAPPYRLTKEKLAAMVGRSVSYINDCVKLNSLCKDAQELFFAGKIEKGHAVLLARISQKDQHRCIEEEDALMRGEQTLYADEASGTKANRDKWAGYTAVSVDELRDWIKRHVRFDYKNADQMLFPETVDALAQAFDDKRKVVEITSEYLAHEDVRNAGPQRVYGERAWKRADGKEKSKACEYAVLGVFASGAERGQSFDVCTRRDKCTIHWGQEIKAREKNAKASKVGSSVKDRWQKEQEDRERKYMQERNRRIRWEKAQPDIIAAVLERVKTLPPTTTGFLAERVVQDVCAGIRIKVPGLTRGKTHEDLIRYLGAVVLIKEIKQWDAAEKFPDVAKYLGIDLSKILPAEKPEAPAAEATRKQTKRKGKGA